MTAKEIKPNTDNNVDNGSVPDIKVPSTGIDVGAVIPDAAISSNPASPASGAAANSKFTPGKKMRGDNVRKGGHNANGQQRGRPGRGDGRERIKPEFDSKIIDIRRVTRVAAGGRRYNFSVAVVAGDRKGRVGVGLGKGNDTALAVEKATREAKKNLIKVPLSAQMTIPHSVEAKYGSAVIKIFPARGSGVVAGSSARVVIELAGIKDVCAKFLSGSKNSLNNAKVAIAALNKLIKVPRKSLHTSKEAVKTI